MKKLNIYCQTSTDLLINILHENSDVEYLASIDAFLDQLKETYLSACSYYDIIPNIQMFTTASEDEDSRMIGVIAVDETGTVDMDMTYLLETVKQLLLDSPEWIVSRPVKAA